MQSAGTVKGNKDQLQIRKAFSKWPKPEFFPWLVKEWAEAIWAVTALQEIGRGKGKICIYRGGKKEAWRIAINILI